MNIVNKIFYIIGTVCIIIALYIIVDKYVFRDTVEVNFNEKEEILLLDNKLIETGSSLGWIVIVDGINNQNNDKYNITYNENLFDNYSYKQLFVMEYILSDINTYDDFIILSAFNNSVIEGTPTDDFTLAYLDYDKYNIYYKSLFGEDFDISNAKNGNTSYDDSYVYYENRRAGSNGVYVSMIQADSVSYKDGLYTGEVTITYSTRAGELIGSEKSNASIGYVKDINDNIIFKSFTLKDS